MNINPFNYNIYVSVINYGIYQSKDDGKTFTKISNNQYNLTMGLRSIFNPKMNDGLFYVADDKKGLFVINETNNSWNDVSEYLQKLRMVLKKNIVVLISHQMENG